MPQRPQNQKNEVRLCLFSANSEWWACPCKHDEAIADWRLPKTRVFVPYLLLRHHVTLPTSWIMVNRRWSPDHARSCAIWIPQKERSCWYEYVPAHFLVSLNLSLNLHRRKDMLLYRKWSVSWLPQVSVGWSCNSPFRPVEVHTKIASHRFFVYLATKSSHLHQDKETEEESKLQWNSRMTFLL